jgi:hypothetical protein
MTEAMGGLFGEGVLNNTSRNRKPSIYPQDGVRVKPKKKKLKKKPRKSHPNPSPQFL